MRASSGCSHGHRVKVFLNGEQVPDAFYADEEGGFVWTAVRAEGKLVAEVDSGEGSRFWNGVQVLRLTGKVEVRVQPQQGVTEEHLRKIIDETSSLPKIYFWAD